MEVEGEFELSCIVLMNSNTTITRGDFEQNDALPWVERYRPTSLDNIVSQDDIVATSGCVSSVFRNSQAFH